MSTADETDTPAPAEKAAPKPRRPRKPRAKAAEAPAETKADAPPAEPATPEPAKPKRAAAKPATRRAPVRKAPARNPARTAAPRTKTVRSAAAARPGYAAIAGAAGVGIALGVLAMLGRKAVVQAPTALAEDWASALAAEHQAVLALFDRLEATEPGATARRAALLGQLRHLVARHAIQEETVIYPALRQAGWRDEADALHASHGAFKQALYDLGHRPAGAGWGETLRAFRTAFESHRREEEERLFPALRGELTEAENKALAAAMNREGFKLA